MITFSRKLLGNCKWVELLFTTLLQWAEQMGGYVQTDMKPAKGPLLKMNTGTTLSFIHSRTHIPSHKDRPSKGNFLTKRFVIFIHLHWWVREGGACWEVCQNHFSYFINAGHFSYRNFRFQITCKLVSELFLFLTVVFFCSVLFWVFWVHQYGFKIISLVLL